MSPFEPAAPPNAGPLTGTLLADRYELGALLGKGGMGHVYASRDRKLQREVAVKLLGSASPDREAMRRFSREALATGSLQHPNVVAVFDAGEDNGRPYLVTELLRGGTLRALIDRGPLPPPQAFVYARQVIAGLAAAHDKGFTHRDLKPENIFITEEGWLKILDFGLVKLTESLHVSPAPDAAGSTGVGRTLGTIGYMAPEQVRGQPVDPRADLFNFGLVYYEMLVGARAFKGNSSTETSYSILFKQPPPLPKTVPQTIRRLIDQCLQKDREHRPASARAVLSSIQELSSRPRRGFPWRRRTAVVACLAIALGVLFFTFRRELASFRTSPPIEGPRLTAPISGSVAVLPFDSRGAPRFAPLAEGVGDLLARDMEGSTLRAVDPASVLRAVGGEPISEVSQARSAALRLSAKYFVLGRIEERKGELVFEAVLHITETEQLVTVAGARGKAVDILQLVRRLSDKLQNLTRTPEETQALLAELTRRTSRSPDALQAWLEGERVFRRGRFRDALVAYQRAVDADAEFALALYRIGKMTSLFQPSRSEEALRRALHYADRLTPAEHTLVEAHLAVQHGSLTDAQQLFERTAHEHADDAEAWMELGDYYFHLGPLKGHSPQEAEIPFQQVLVLDPLNIEAIAHLTDLAQLRGERAVVSKLADRLLGLTDDLSKMNDFGLARAWAHGDVVEHDEIMAKLRAPGVTRFVLLNAMVRTEWLLDGSRDPDTLAALTSYEDGFQPAASANLIGGRFEAARKNFAEAAAKTPAGDSTYYLLWLEALEFNPVSESQLATVRANAAQRLAQIADPSRAPAKKFLLGLLAVRAGDLVEAETAAHALDTMPSLEGSSIASDLGLALRARILAKKKDYAGALALVDKEQLRIPAGLAIFYDRAGENFFRASLLTALHRVHEALPLYEALDFYSQIDPIFAPPAHLYKARIYEGLGETRLAIEHYEKFAEMWKNCEREQQKEVEDVRLLLKKLRGP